MAGIGLARVMHGCRSVPPAPGVGRAGLGPASSGPQRLRPGKWCRWHRCAFESGTCGAISGQFVLPPHFGLWSCFSASALLVANTVARRNLLPEPHRDAHGVIRKNARFGELVARIFARARLSGSDFCVGVGFGRSRAHPAEFGRMGLRPTSSALAPKPEPENGLVNTWALGARFRACSQAPPGVLGALCFKGARKTRPCRRTQRVQCRPDGTCSLEILSYLLRGTTLLRKVRRSAIVSQSTRPPRRLDCRPKPSSIRPAC